MSLTTYSPIIIFTAFATGLTYSKIFNLFKHTPETTIRKTVIHTQDKKESVYLKCNLIDFIYLPEKYLNINYTLLL